MSKTTYFVVLVCYFINYKMEMVLVKCKMYSTLGQLELETNYKCYKTT